VGKWTKTFGVVWLAAASMLAAPLLDEPVATLTLKNGTVLKEARAKGFFVKVVLVTDEGGARTVPYELFPDEFQTALAAKRQAALDSELAAPTRRGAEGQKFVQVQAVPPAPVAAPPAAPEPELHQGCRLTFVSSKEDVVILKIENTTDQVVSLSPTQFGARSAAGEEFSGARWMGIHYAKDRIAAAWNNNRSVDPGTTVTLGLMLTGEPKAKDDSIVTVFWK
jgi:hypothetical protein